MTHIIRDTWVFRKNNIQNTGLKEVMLGARPPVCVSHVLQNCPCVLYEDGFPFLKKLPKHIRELKQTEINRNTVYFDIASWTATATATVMPTIGLLPAPRKPIISTCAGTEEEPANCASECIRPRVSVIP